MFISCIFGIFMGKCIYVIFGINKFSLQLLSVFLLALNFMQHWMQTSEQFQYKHLANPLTSRFYT